MHRHRAIRLLAAAAVATAAIGLSAVPAANAATFRATDARGSTAVHVGASSGVSRPTLLAAIDGIPEVRQSPDEAGAYEHGINGSPAAATPADGSSGSGSDWFLYAGIGVAVVIGITVLAKRS